MAGQHWRTRAYARHRQGQIEASQGLELSRHDLDHAHMYIYIQTYIYTYVYIWRTVHNSTKGSNAKNTRNNTNSDTIHTSKRRDVNKLLQYTPKMLLARV